MQKLYFILIASVFILSLLFAVLIWRQTIKFEKKALAAKQAKEEYLKQLQIEREEEERRLAAEIEQQEKELEESSTDSLDPTRVDNNSTKLNNN